MATENVSVPDTPAIVVPAPAPVSSAKPKPVGFADSFWSADYAGGLGVLFTKLQQGVVENQQVLTIASMRAEAEEIYSDKLGQIAPTNDRLTGGFGRDDGASVRKAYEGVRGEMVEASKNHRKIAMNIRELVVNPFGRWCDAHAMRVQNSQDDLMGKVKAHDSQAAAVKKLRTQYFNKCRQVEDIEEENKLAFPVTDKEKGKEPERDAASISSPVQPKSPPPKIFLPDEDPDDQPVELGDQIYAPEQIKKILTHMLETITLGELKVPILGTYTNVSSGTDIVEYLQKHMGASSVGYAEKMGQDLVDGGFLRLVGNVGSTFANSSRMKYQWRPRAWQLTGLPDRRKTPSRTGTSDSLFDVASVGAITETLQAWNPLNNPYPNETPAERLKREAKEADNRYKEAVKRLDAMRCNLEESMMDHLKFLERCETDRLRAIRSVILDFSGAISNSIPSFQSQVDNMMLYQETIQPLGDLRYLLESYRTGSYAPKVTPYENYYGLVEGQTFGVDLEARARADRKRVPIVVTSILTFLDDHYPDLEGDEARRAIWLADVPLKHAHHLRAQINNGGPVPREILEKYDMAVIASVLKLYLLELPDSLVSSQVYEIIRTIYNATNEGMINPISMEAPDSTARIQVLQSTLGQLRLNNIATLDAITTHLTRLIDLTSADEAYISSLAHNLAPCVLRPRTESALTIEEKHSYRLVRDLFDHKEAIFGELKRQSSASAAAAGAAARQRAVSSTDESSRRAAMEARQKAITERQRDRSPAPAARHRRDKSSEGGRFPVVVSPRTDHHRTSLSGPSNRMSLDVPTSPVTPRTRELTRQDGTDGATNGGHAGDSSHTFPAFTATAGPGPHIPPPMDDDSPIATTPQSAGPVTATQEHDGISKSPSLKRTAVIGAGRRLNRGAGGSLKDRSGLRSASETMTESHPQGVELTDKPFDD